MIIQGRPPYPPAVGWGQVLHEFFAADTAIYNYAKARRSTKNFIDEGRWSAVAAKLQQDDYLIINFGRNDQIEEPERFAAAYGAYKDNLRRIVQEARSQGAQPILATPLPRRRFDPQGQFQDTMGDYPAAVRELAEEEGLPLLDLHRRMHDLYVDWGADRSKALAWWLEPGVYPELPKGKQDNSHLSLRGAMEVCRLVVAELRGANTPLTRHLKHLPVEDT